MSVRALPCVARFTMLALLSFACAKSPPTGGAGTYRGLATGPAESGVLEVTVAEAASGPLPASGTLTFPSKSLTLTGTLDKSKAQLSLSSSDGYQLVADSRPTYAYGYYTNSEGTDVGPFGLLLESAGSSVGLYCGTLVNTSTTTQAGTLNFGVVGIPGADALCLGPGLSGQGFALTGGLTKDGSLLCAASSGVQFQGSVSDSSSNVWGTGNYYGTWSVTPCASNGRGDSDGGVSDDSGTADTSATD